ncbi:MAG: preprotein translocase subunit YajC [Bdellovibrionota bacterium]
MKISKFISAAASLSLSVFVSSTCFAQQATANAEAPVQVAGSAGAQAAPGAPAWINFVLIGGIIVFMWLFVFRPQSKRAKEQKNFLASLTPGLEVITSGGIIGTITEVKDTTVLLNIGSNSNITVLKSSISGKYVVAVEVKK